MWTLGHRNVEGLAFDDAGRLWASEFGLHTWDELNLIEKGNNYGWPQVEGKGSVPRFRNPQVVWPTDAGLSVGPGVPRRPPVAGLAARRTAVAGGRPRRPGH